MNSPSNRKLFPLTTALLKIGNEVVGTDSNGNPITKLDMLNGWLWGAAINGTHKGERFSVRDRATIIRDFLRRIDHRAGTNLHESMRKTDDRHIIEIITGLTAAELDCLAGLAGVRKRNVK